MKEKLTGTIHFDIISNLPIRDINERLQDVTIVEKNRGATVSPVFKGELYDKGFSIRRNAPLSGMFASLQGTYVPEGGVTRVVVLATGLPQVHAAFVVTALFIAILLFAMRGALMHVFFTGGDSTPVIIVGVGVAIAIGYYIYAIQRLKWGLKRDRAKLSEVLAG